MASMFPGAVPPLLLPFAGDALAPLPVAPQLRVVGRELVPVLAVGAPSHVVRSVAHAIFLVLGVCAVGQIFKAAVGRVTIKVPDLLIGGPVERFGHQAVNFNPTIFYGYAPVSVTVLLLLQHLSSNGVCRPVFSSQLPRAAAYPAQVTGFVVGQAGYGLPDFAHVSQHTKEDDRV